MSNNFWRARIGVSQASSCPAILQWKRNRETARNHFATATSSASPSLLDQLCVTIGVPSAFCDTAPKGVVLLRGYFRLRGSHVSIRRRNGKGTGARIRRTSLGYGLFLILGRHL